MKKRQNQNQSRVPLSGEDRILWNKVARTVSPLSDQAPQLLKEDMARLLDASSPEPVVKGTVKSKQAIALSPTPIVKPAARQSHPIEETILRKLSKGRQSIDSRIDLHGMTQDRARFALLDFLQQSQLQGHRIVLVITGKGNEGRGVLRTNVPQWLNLPGFRELVNGFRTSHGSHGGEGALYVRLHHHPSKRRNR